MENTERKRVTLLWSGGWDGTFRLLQLAQYDIEILPIHLVHAAREGEKYERAAMEKVLEQIKQDKAFKAEILDIVYYDVQWVLENCQDKEISEAYRYLNKEYKIGKQYEWFALLCKKLNTQMESGLLCLEGSTVKRAITAEGTMLPIENDYLEGRYHVLPQGEKQAAYLVFGNLILPIVMYTKIDEERIARENGWIEIMKLSWFCHLPINGQPCGLCNPCRDAMNNGMVWRMPKESQFRYRHRFIFRCIRKVKKLAAIITGTGNISK